MSIPVKDEIQVPPAFKMYSLPLSVYFLSLNVKEKSGSESTVAQSTVYWPFQDLVAPILAGRGKQGECKSENAAWVKFRLGIGNAVLTACATTRRYRWA